jgi:hypothetical protein
METTLTTLEARQDDLREFSETHEAEIRAAIKAAGDQGPTLVTVDTHDLSHLFTAAHLLQDLVGEPFSDEVTEALIRVGNASGEAILASYGFAL